MTHLTDDELMKDLERWLNTPELQHKPNAGLISFLASVHRNWRIKNRISTKQRNYTVALLNKHWAR